MAEKKRRVETVERGGFGEAGGASEAQVTAQLKQRL